MNHQILYTILLKRIHALIICAENKNELKSSSTIEIDEAEALLFVLRKLSYHSKLADPFFKKIIELGERLDRIKEKESVV